MDKGKIRLHFLVVVGAIIACLGGWAYVKQRQATRWLETSGTLKSAAVKEVHENRGMISYLPAISYTYEVNG